VHDIVEVGVGNGVIEYTSDEPLIAFPLLLSATSRLYRPAVLGLAVNRNDDEIEVAVGVVKTAVVVTTKSDHRALPTGCTVMLHTMCASV